MPAAVLVTLIPTNTGTSVILTRRAMHLAAHAGQISFPGGRVDDTDDCAVGTAIREAEEEIGLDPGAVDVLGQMGTYLTVTGYLVTPVVAAVTAPVALVANPDEVDDIFTVPLSFLRDPAHRRTEQLIHRGRGRTIYQYQYGLHDIWGATAAMLVHLVDHIVQDPAV
jgi:8-oxo-dGTP pyrophosphatase MutT (NUDIX family)